MKKKILSLLIAGVMMLGLAPNVMAATSYADGYWYKDESAAQATLVQTNHNPYEMTDAYECARLWTQIKTVDGVDSNNGMKAHPNDGGHTVLKDTQSYFHAEYDDMDFGTHSPKYVEIYASAWADGRSIEVKTGSGTILATVPVPNSTGITSGSKYYNFAEPHVVEITETITGVQDIIIHPNSTSMNIDKFRFVWEYETVTDPAINAASTTAGATASIERNKETAETRQAKLLLAEYDTNGAMVKLRETASTPILNGGQVTGFTVPNETKGTGAQGFGAYFWYDDDSEVKNAVMQSVAAASGTLTTKKIDAAADNGWVTISGSGVANETVKIAVVPTTYDKNSTMYSQSASIKQLYETTITDGTYNYKFKMPSGVTTGSYKAVVKGATINEEVQFSYTNPDDIYNVLLALSTASTADVAADTVKNNADIFGTTAEMYNNMQPADKTQLKSAVDAFFASNTLSHQINGDYSLWTNGLKAVIIPEATVSYIKNVKNVTNSIDYINKYKTELGISANAKHTTYFENCKENIVSALIKNSSSLTTSNFVSLFEEAVVVGYFNDAESWGFAGEALINFASDLAGATPNVTSDKIAIYNSLINTAKQDLMNKFINKNFVTFNEIALLFMNNIDAYNIPENITNPKYELEPSKVKDEDEFTMEVWHENKEETEETASVNKAFEDIDSVPWAKSSINYMRSFGVVNGKSDTMFAPNDSITREEFAAIIVRAFGLGTGDVSRITFGDVNKGAWYAPYIAKAAERGIVNGMDNNKFGVGQNVTREQIAAMLERATKATNKNIIPTKSRVGFADFAYISDYAYDAVSTLAKAEIINGTGNDNFSPKKSATRAEAVVMLHRLLTNIK